MATPERPGAEPPSEPFCVVAVDYLAFSERMHTRATHRTRRSLVAGKLVPFFGARPLVQIGPRDVEALLASQARVGPATRNRVLGALSALLEWGVRTGRVRVNVARGFPRAREAVVALPLMSLADQERFLAAVSAERRLLFVMALDTGARLGELLRLAWSDVDLARGVVQIRRSKAGRPRMVRLSQRLTTSLREARGADGLVFSGAVGADGALRWSWRRCFKRAAAVVGRPELRVHDLRHLAAINLVRAGVDLPTVQAHLGHRHLVSTLRYAAYADETASGRAAAALDRLHGEARPRIH
ncbi:MAG: site-specific integrase [Planctomycetota bacterium]|nr:site-specific integrase [Planctomycetota bacterium]